MSVFIWIGFISLFIAGILVGAWTNGDRQRANFHSDVSKERIMKRKLSLWLFCISLISFAITAIYNFLIK